MSKRLYHVHSMFKTIQGEGYHAGRVAIFIRFSGCNVWSGLEKDRTRDAENNSQCARICDTKFAGIDWDNEGGRYEARRLAENVQRLWGDTGRLNGIDSYPMVVLTGGEPSLQWDEELFAELRKISAYVAMETNGTRRMDPCPHWLTLSPKPPMAVIEQHYHELKVLYPLFDPEPWTKYSTNRYIQPVDYTPTCGHPCGCQAGANAKALEDCVAYVMKHPEWRMGAQLHKVWGVQ